MKITIRTALAAFVIASTAGLAAAGPDRAPPPDLVSRWLGLRECTVVDLSGTPKAGEPAGTTQTVGLTVAGRPCTLEITPHSVRSDLYRVYRIGADGEPRLVPAGPVNTFRGRVADRPGTTVAAAVLSDGLHATIDMEDGERYWVQPVPPALGWGGAFHVVYRDADAPLEGVSCGTNDKIAAAPRFAMEPADPPAEADGGLPGHVAEIACDADFEYFTEWGEDVEARINAIINQVDLQYEIQVDITHEITAILVRTTFGGPYTQTDAFSLLTQFRNQWLGQHFDITRDLAQLFTGKNLDGTTIGIAWDTGEVCGTGAYSLVQSDYNGVFSCATDLTAHELGHLWGASHCSCPVFTMNATITCANQFSAASIASIIAHRDTRLCLNSDYCFALTEFPADYISHVSIGMIDHASGASTYSDFTSISTELARGQEYDVEVTLADSAVGDVGGLWIDWNDDKDFDDDGEELVTWWSGAGPYLASFVVPEDAILGASRLRIRLQDGDVDPLLFPCGLVDIGEVEDYGVEIVIFVPPPPVNDNCSDPTVITSAGATPYTTVNATTDGPDEVIDCDFFGYSHLESDVWFRYDAECTGSMTVSVCDSDFDTKLGVYDGCPTFPHETIIGCNDDFCADKSSVTFIAIEGLSYWFRVGGFEGLKGSGTLLLENDCPPPTCEFDLDGDGAVGFTDLISVLNAWGCVGCPEDVDGSGTVGLTDLITILSFWGPC